MSQESPYTIVDPPLRSPPPPGLAASPRARSDHASPPPRKRARLEDDCDGAEIPGSAHARAITPKLPAIPVRFPIQPLHRFQGASASIKRPREIAHFSYDYNHEYREDESGIQYYHDPEIGADLKEGFDTFKHYEDKEDPHLDSLLRTLVSKEKREEQTIQADFITWRGMMTKIMTAPFDMFAEFEMLATLHQGTIYIEEDFGAKSASRAAEADSQNRSSRPSHLPSHEMMTFWGYKFETLALLPDTPPNTTRTFIENRTKAVVSNHAQHCSIVRTGFGPHSIILGGEVDGLWEPKPDQQKHPDAPIPWVELKTTEELGRYPSERDILKYERKLLKFWAQSFLLGVTKVIVGFRSKQGILRVIDVYETSQIPGMVRRGTRCWDGNTCINFATAFLDNLKKTLTEEGVYKISLKKKSGIIEIVRVKSEGTGGILSKEFLDWREREEETSSSAEPAGDVA